MDKKDLFNLIDDIGDDFLRASEKEVNEEKTDRWKFGVATFILATAIASSVIFIMVSRNNRQGSDVVVGDITKEETYTTEIETTVNEIEVPFSSEEYKVCENGWILRFDDYGMVQTDCSGNIMVITSDGMPLEITTDEEIPRDYKTGDCVEIYAKSNELQIDMANPYNCAHAVRVLKIADGTIDSIPHSMIIDLEGMGLIKLPEWLEYIREEQNSAFEYVGGGFSGAGSFSINFKNDGTYTYSEGYLSSYFGRGGWKLDGNILTIKDFGEGRTNKFTVDIGGIIWISEGSDNFIYVKLSDGALFNCKSITNVLTKFKTDVEYIEYVKNYIKDHYDNYELLVDGNENITIMPTYIKDKFAEIVTILNTDKEGKNFGYSYTLDADSMEILFEDVY